MRLLAMQAVDIDRIRRDGGTQVRETLNQEWIAELASLYEDGGHEIEPPLLMLDDDGNHWLVDGFHRVEAMVRAGWTAVMATVRHGSLDAAKMLAAQMNKNGLQRTAGDKKRAILLALSTAEGKKMGVRELARHCGVSVAHTQRIVSGEEVSHGGQSSPCTSSIPSPKNGKREVAVLWARIDAALRADPNRLSTDIAREIGCNEAVVRRRRDELGLPRISKAEASRARHCATRDRAAELVKEHPEWTNRRIAEESGAAPETVAKVRESVCLPPSDKRGQRAADAKPNKACTTSASTPAAPPRLRIVEAPKPAASEPASPSSNLVTTARAAISRWAREATDEEWKQIVKALDDADTARAEKGAAAS